MGHSSSFARPQSYFGIALSLVAACGGSQFEAGAPGPDGGSPSQESGAPLDSAMALDGPSEASPGAESGAADATGGCQPLGAGATDVYVDQRFTGATRTGVAACPFRSLLEGINAALTLTGLRTVHVAGDASGLTYVETGAVTIPSEVTLKGDGPTQTIVRASGSCGTGTCAVLVQGGAVLDGFTVISAMGDGVVTAAAGPAPVVRNVAANGSKGNGVLALGAAELGPNISANKNGAAGLESPSTAAGTLHVIAGANTSMPTRATASTWTVPPS